MPYLDVNGTRLYYELSGTGGPVFVLVHGGLCSRTDWAQQVRSLSGAHTVLTLDLRGHGLSTGAFDDCRIEQWAADVNASIDMLELGPVVLTGHSMGSRVVVEAAWQRPENVGAVVLLDGSRKCDGSASTEPAKAETGVTRAETILADAFDLTIGPYALPATRAYILANMNSAPPALVDATLRSMKAWDIEKADSIFENLRPDLPLLAIQSTYHDQFVPRYSLTHETETTPYLDFLRRARPDIRIKVLTETGHFSMLERSDEVTSLIRDFGIAALSRQRP